MYKGIAFPTLFITSFLLIQSLVGYQVFVYRIGFLIAIPVYPIVLYFSRWNGKIQKGIGLTGVLVGLVIVTFNPLMAKIIGTLLVLSFLIYYIANLKDLQNIRN